MNQHSPEGPHVKRYTVIFPILYHIKYSIVKQNRAPISSLKTAIPIPWQIVVKISLVTSFKVLIKTDRNCNLHSVFNKHCLLIIQHIHCDRVAQNCIILVISMSTDQFWNRRKCAFSSISMRIAKRFHWIVPKCGWANYDRFINWFNDHSIDTQIAFDAKKSSRCANWWSILSCNSIITKWTQAQRWRWALVLNEFQRSC